MSVDADVSAALRRIADRYTYGRIDEADVTLVVNALAVLHADDVADIGALVAREAALYHRQTAPRWIWPRPPTEESFLQRVPHLRYLFLFHYDGHLRQAALEGIDGPLPGPFFLAAVVYRLNDWVEQVRDAARHCATRVFPTAEPTMVAAIGGLLARGIAWQRWGRNAAMLQDLFSRPEVTGALMENLRHARTGTTTAILYAALRNPAFDPHLPALARDAFLPSVRALASRCLMSGTARWPIGRQRQWVDKSMGRYRTVPAFGERSLSIPCDRDNFLRDALQDRSAMVRKSAALELSNRCSQMPDARTLAKHLATDPSRSVRAIAAFILRHAS